MTTTYLIPQFIIEYLKKSRGDKFPQKLIGERLKKFKTPEIEKWFKENEVDVRYIWNFFVSQGKNEFYYKTCAVCGKRIKTKTLIRNPDAKFCSRKCSANSKEFLEKRKQTCLGKYGVEYASQSKEVKEKMKETNLERYGCEYVSQSKEIQEKRNQTWLKKYGVEHPFQSEEVQEKRKQTCLEKYGVSCALHSKEIHEKVKQTNLEKYGVEHPLQSKEVQDKMKETNLERYGVKFVSQSKKIREKIKQTFLEKYGVENPLQSKKVQDKMKETNLERYGVEYSSQSKEVQDKIFQTKRSNYWETFCSFLREKDIIPLFNKEEYINDTGRKFKCLVCNEEFVSEGTYNYEKKHKNKDGSYTTLISHSIYCPSCSCKYSKKEKEVVEFIKTFYKGEIKENFKGLFPSHPYMELDIYIPQLNIGIEFDGTYWHSLKEVQERDNTKNTLCEQRRITLLRIKESDWNNNPENVKEEIKTFLNLK